MIRTAIVVNPTDPRSQSNTSCSAAPVSQPTASTPPKPAPYPSRHLSSCTPTRPWTNWSDSSGIATWERDGIGYGGTLRNGEEEDGPDGQSGEERPEDGVNEQDWERDRDEEWLFEWLDNERGEEEDIAGEGEAGDAVEVEEI
jgi:hypothetical protein